MPVVRVYLPLTTAQLDALAAGLELGPPPLAAHGVTDGLGRPGLTRDVEELEHLAWVAATEEAGSLAGGARRVVAALDVDQGWVREARGVQAASRVEVTAPVPRARVVSFHVDEAPGDTGTADLLWYDVTELDDVRRLLAP